jgi:hypothetical protein
LPFGEDASSVRHALGVPSTVVGSAPFDTAAVPFGFPVRQTHGHAGGAAAAYVSPGTVHRDSTPTDEAVVVLVCFVGSGPVVVNVGDPRC